MKYSAILLIGPTGSGKSPLGDALERIGFHGVTCHHFDFGERLRTCVKSKPSFLGADEIEVIRVRLQTNGLLENACFPIARKILNAFIEEKRVRDRDLVVLNGLPRHQEQAEALADSINVVMVVELRADPRIILKRIHTNTGGDRAGRTDDSVREIKYKVRLFHEHTEPLLAFYRERGVPVRTVHVTQEITPEEMVRQLPLG